MAKNIVKPSVRGAARPEVPQPLIVKFDPTLTFSQCVDKAYQEVETDYQKNEGRLRKLQHTALKDQSALASKQLAAESRREHALEAERLRQELRDLNREDK